ncbi:MAG: hypothetical protein ACTSO9_19635 [Candidatus Helarchaeota archaeon]
MKPFRREAAHVGIARFRELTRFNTSQDIIHGDPRFQFKLI